MLKITWKWSISSFLSLVALSYGDCALEHKQDGEVLAKQYCGACHAYPAPELLDKATWATYILPRMGYMAGMLPMDSVGANFIEKDAGESVFQNPLVFRKTPLMRPKEWDAVKRFYLDQAPEKLPVIDFSFQVDSLPLFKADFPNYHFSPPGVSLVDIDQGLLTIGDAQQKKLFAFDPTLNLQRTALAPEGVVSRHGLPEGEIITCMGSFSPTDRPLGKILFFPNNTTNQVFVLIDSLRRPVHTAVADLDGDGLFDLLVSEFGKWNGSLNWWKNRGNGQFDRHSLFQMTGAVRTVVRDLNGDSLPDVLALFGQGDEGLFAFYNLGKGVFEQQRMLRFPPSYGSSYFDLFDYNGDQYPDIIYTNGDNADYAPIVKPYHGIRIFQNLGGKSYKEVWFQSYPGAYKAIPADFDEDGDMDIAAISFFPNYADGLNGGFLYLENKGGNTFRSYQWPLANRGRWMVMDSGDIDRDGDLDLCLGALAFEVPDGLGLVAQWTREGIPFVLLRNTLK